MKKLVLTILLMVSAMAWGQDAFNGTWKIKLDSAKFPEKPDQIMLQNGRYTCSTCVPKLDVKADGTDQKVAGAKTYDTMSVQSINDHQLKMVSKKDGKVIGEETTTVAADGNTAVVEFTDYPAQGDPVKGKVTTMRVGKAAAGSSPISGSWRTKKVDTVSDNGLTITFKSTGTGLQMSTPTGESYDAKFDGQDYPIVGGRTPDMVSLKKVDARTIEETIKRDGKVIATSHMSVASDGKLHVATTDKERGNTMTWIADKQ